MDRDESRTSIRELGADDNVGGSRGRMEGEILVACVDEPSCRRDSSDVAEGGFGELGGVHGVTVVDAEDLWDPQCHCYFDELGAAAAWAVPVADVGGEGEVGGKEG